MRLRLPKSRSWRYATIFGILVVLFFGGLYLLRWNTYRQSAAELRAIVEKLDREDPGWRWESILQNREPIPDEQNSALLIEKVLAQPNVMRGSHDPPIGEWRRLPEKMPFEVADWAGEFVSDRKQGIELARQLADYPEGRHAIFKPEDYLMPLLSSTDQDTQCISHILRWDMRVNAQLGRYDLCVRGLRALRNAARSLGIGTLLSRMMIRIKIDIAMADCLQEILSQGMIPTDDLANLQREIFEESREPLLASCLRMHRATAMKIMQYNGNSNRMAKFKSQLGMKRNGFFEKLQIETIEYRYPPVAEADQANMLRQMSAIIEACELPASERDVRIRNIENRSPEESVSGLQARNFLSKWLVSGIDGCAMAEARWRSKLRSAAMAIAAERFRLANERWPKSLDELVPNFIEKVEDDPIVGRPLIYKVLDDGIVVYGVGRDNNDHGGDVLGELVGRNREELRYVVWPSTDLGIRLWNPNRRGK